jgi:hypothetical protein
MLAWKKKKNFYENNFLYDARRTHRKEIFIHEKLEHTHRSASHEREDDRR